MVSPAIEAYLSRMSGQRHDPAKLRAAPRQPPSRTAVLLSSFVGSFVGIAIVASLTYNSQWFLDRNTPVIAGSFGASAVLIYGAIEAPLSQPRNVIHPPASATALIAVTGGATIYDLGYWYVVCPIALGVALMMIIAMLVNNVSRKYPTHWWNPKKKMVTVVDQDMSTPIADFVPNEEEAHERQGDQDDKDNRDEDSNGRDNIVRKDCSGTTASMKSDHGAAIPSSSSTVNVLGGVSPTATQRLSLHSAPHHDSQPQFAVYYGGERNEALRNGGRMHRQDSFDKASVGQDLEHGRREHQRTSILIEMRGSPNPSAGSAAVAAEEQYRSTIEQLEQRIQELESQLAARSSK
ncbi:hypothetical protein EDD11_001965 [Mortierella claussenii]|nr:hypothetical protein EDD11_001965 [Mortierella claussenii]